VHTCAGVEERIDKTHEHFRVVMTTHSEFLKTWSFTINGVNVNACKLEKMFCRCFGITGKMPTVTRELNSITRV
jgi:hypothetical protein